LRAGKSKKKHYFIILKILGNPLLLLDERGNQLNNSWVCLTVLPPNRSLNKRKIYTNTGTQITALSSSSTFLRWMLCKLLGDVMTLAGRGEDSKVPWSVARNAWKVYYEKCLKITISPSEVSVIRDSGKYMWLMEEIWTCHWMELQRKQKLSICASPFPSPPTSWYSTFVQAGAVIMYLVTHRRKNSSEGSRQWKET